MKAILILLITFNVFAQTKTVLNADFVSNITANENAIKNASFELNSTKSWATSGSGISLAIESTVIEQSSGSKSLKATLSSSTNGEVYNTFTGSSQWSSVQVSASCKIKTSLSNIKFCGVSNSVDTCVDVSSGNTWASYAVALVSSSSNLNGVKVKTTASNTGDIYIDGCSFSSGDIPYLTASNQDYDWTSYGTTGDFTGFGTPTGIALYHKRQGSDLLIRGNFTCGTTTATEARLNLPNSLISTSTISTVELAGFATSSNTGGDTVPLILIEPSKGYMTFGYKTSGQSGLTKQNGSAYCASGNTISFNAKFSINGWNTPNQVIATVKDNVQMSVANGKPKACTWRMGSTGTVTDDWSDCISGNCTKNSTGNYTCTFTTSYFSVAPICQLQPRTGGNGNRSDGITETSSAVTWQNIEGTATVSDSNYSGFCVGY